MKPNPSTGLAERSSTAALAAQAEQPATQTTEAAAEAPKPAKPYKPEPITAANIKDAEQVISRHVVYCDSGTEIDHLADPTYWTHVAAMLRTHAHIEAYAFDETWMAELLVIEVGRLQARVKVLRFYDLTEGVSGSLDQAIDEPYYAKYLGAQHQWGVVRRSDQAKMEDDIGTRDQAQLKARQMSITHAKK